jgi:hypothetical protein
MKLSIKSVDANFSDKVLFHLFKVTGLSDPDQQNECIGKTIGQVVNECSTPGDEQHNLNLIALRSAGKNLFETVELIRSLYIIGDGECPKCGSNDFAEDNFSKTCNICFERWDKNEFSELNQF